MSINQDSQGKTAHFDLFLEAVKKGKTITLDRMNFDRAQRAKYIAPAREAGYQISATVFHTPKAECIRRCEARKDHETIKDVETAKKVINFFFQKYEKPTEEEVDFVDSVPYFASALELPQAIVVDLDGTLCNINHRLHYLSKENGKKPNWSEFFRAMGGDYPNSWCVDLMRRYMGDTNIVLCSGRPEEYRELTVEWLTRHNIRYDHLFMRPSGDYRQDDIAKEIILDFDILSQFTPKFFVDDRKQVVDMWRRRGFTCLQCAAGEF